MKKYMAVLCCLPAFAASANIVLISDNRSMHVSGSEAGVPFDVTSTPSAPFAAYSQVIGGGSAATDFQNSTLTSQGFAVRSQGQAIFIPALGQTANYHIVNTFDVSFQVVTPEQFELEVFGSALNFGLSSGTALANFQKDGAAFQGVSDLALNPVHAISLNGTLDPGLYHINLETIISGSANAGQLTHGSSDIFATLKFVPDQANSAALLLGSMMLLPFCGFGIGLCRKA